MIRGGTTQAKPPRIALVVQLGIDVEVGRMVRIEQKRESIERQAESHARTVTAESLVGAKARHTSAVPSCAFVRRTSVQVRPAPVTPVTVIPGDVASEATNASNSSASDAVEKDGDVMFATAFERFVETVTSMARAHHAGAAAPRRTDMPSIEPITGRRA